MNGDPLRALIVDDNDYRSAGISRHLSRMHVDAERESLIVRKSGAGCCADNLMDYSDRIGRTDILFLHLGPSREQVRKRSSGNECAMEFYVAHRPLLERVCVVAYSGSTAKEPRQFTELRTPDWHRFCGGILNADQFNLDAFIRRFLRYRAAPPPLNWLTWSPSLSGELRGAIRNAFVGISWLPPDYGQGDRHVETSRDLVNRCAGLFDGDPDGDCLLEELADSRSLYAVAQALVHFKKQAGRSEESIRHASWELHEVLQKFKNEAGPSVPDRESDKKKRDAEIRAWQHRRARLNHDWFRVTFLTFVQAWCKELDCPSSAFPPEVDWRSALLEWQKRKCALIALLDEAQRLFVTVAHDPPELRAQVARINELIRSVDQLISQLLGGVESEGGGERLYQQLCEISQCLSALPNGGRIP